MPVPCSGIRGGPRFIARPAKCGGPSAHNCVSGISLYIGLCSGFILLYAPAFLSLLSLFERKEGIMRICVKRHKAVKGEEKGGERSRTDKKGDEQIREEQQA